MPLFKKTAAITLSFALVLTGTGEAFAQLRAALGSHGINVDRFDVTADLASDVPAEPPGQERPGSAASSGRDRPRQETGRSTNVVSSNDAEGIAENDAVPATTAVGNVRLDIRV